MSSHSHANLPDFPEPSKAARLLDRALTYSLPLWILLLGIVAGSLCLGGA